MVVVATMKKWNKYADEEEVEDDKDNYEDERQKTGFASHPSHLSKIFKTQHMGLLLSNQTLINLIYIYFHIKNIPASPIF